MYVLPQFLETLHDDLIFLL